MKYKIKFKGIVIYFLLPVLMGVYFTACKKTMGGIEDESLDRAFTPSGLSVRTVKDSAIFKWNLPVYGSGKSLKYTLELSRDSLFSVLDTSVVTDTTGAVLLDPQIALNTPYFYRVKVNEYKGSDPSGFFRAKSSFRLVGQQYFKVIRDFEITQNTALFHWFQNSNTASLSKIVLTPTPAGSAAVTIPITQEQIIAGSVAVTGLVPDTRYTVQLFSGGKSKGILNIVTAKPVVYTRTVSPADNLAAIILDAVDGEVIGLNPGTYNLSGITYITQKSITIRSLNNDPATTVIKSREINLVGDSAGVSFSGINFDGNYTGTTNGTQFMQLLGSQAVNGSKASFRAVKIENCYIHNYNRCVIRGNAATAANDHSIKSITINSSLIYDIDKLNSGGYYTFSFEKLQLNAFSITKSSLYNLGQGLINMSTALAAPVMIPTVSLDYLTYNNNGGGSGKYAFIDANSNKIVFKFTNSIVANTPISGSLQATSFRASASGNVLSFSNNNYFKLSIAPGGAALNLTGLAQANDISIDLGWTSSTTNFKLLELPEFTKIFSASTNGSTIGDPRWAY